MGTPDQTGWSQIQHLAAKPDHPQAGEAVLLLAAPVSAKDGAVLGREIVARFSEKYFLAGGRGRLEILAKALLAINQEQPFYDSPQPIKLASAVMVERPPFLWLGVGGAAEIWLFRQQKLQPLLASQLNHQTKAISGKAQAGDLFILGSRQFFKTLPQATITASLKNQDPRQAQEILSPLVYQQPGGILAAAIVKPSLVSVSEEPATAVSQKPLRPQEDRPPSRFSAKLASLHRPRWRLPSFHWHRPRLLKPAIKLRRRASYSPQQQRWLRAMAVIFLIFLSVSVAFGWRRQQQQRRSKLVAAKISQAAELTNQARAVRRLDIDKSLALAKKAQAEVETGLKLDPLNPSLKQLQTEIGRLIAVSGGSQQLEPETFFDLRVIADDVQAQDWAFDGHYFWILDHNGRLIRLSKDNKNSQLVSHDPLLKKLRGIFFSGRQLYGWTDKGVYRLADKTFKEAMAADFGSANLWAGWAGNAYRVDTDNFKIWKYPLGNGKLQSPGLWLKEKAAFSGQLTGFGINGSLWLLNNRGKIWRYYAGRRQNFPRQPPLEGAKLLTVMVNQPYLAFWAGQKKMAIILKKDGQLVMRAPLKIDSPRGLVLTDNGKKIFLLTSLAVKVLTLPW